LDLQRNAQRSETIGLGFESLADPFDRKIIPSCIGVDHDEHAEGQFAHDTVWSAPSALDIEPG
jgi:hypothetical protein